MERITKKYIDDLLNEIDAMAVAAEKAEGTAKRRAAKHTPAAGTGKRKGKSAGSASKRGQRSKRSRE